LPVFNVDGLNYIEENWIENHKIPMKRKNMNPNVCGSDAVNEGVDLNRNFGVDFG
jgi:hypothetical protein